MEEIVKEIDPDYACLGYEDYLLRLLILTFTDPDKTVTIIEYFHEKKVDVLDRFIEQFMDMLHDYFPQLLDTIAE